ncbi:glycosyltransferase family 4 protein [Enterovirga sp. GCM10030262]|uniref:glycosyltransferase family 4 protein n=1 Tax=Enterovirga sp. GCM10030262 TaxID=3273391 RepID=UPI00361448C5
MKILVLATCFDPEVTASAPFTTDLCAYLVEQGHEVTAVVAFPHYPQWKRFDGYRGKFVQKDVVRGIKVLRVPNYIPENPTKFRRIAYDSSFAATSFLGALTTGKPDMILAICSPLQTGVTAAALGKVWGVPYVFHVQDLLPEGAVALGIMREGKALKLANKMADFVYDHAEHVSVIGHKLLAGVKAHGVPDSKLSFLPNWVNTDWVTPGSRLSKFREEAGATPEDFVVLYVGNFGEKQQMETLVEAAGLLKDEAGIKFVLVGEGNHRHVAIERAKQLGLDNVTFVGVQPRAKLPDMLATADLLVLHQRREVIDMVMPSKLMSYGASGRPILVAGVGESEGARFIEEADCGMVVEPEQPALLADAIRTLRADEEGRARMGRNARAYIEEHFVGSKVLAKAEALFTRTVEGFRARKSGRAPEARPAASGGD